MDRLLSPVAAIQADLRQNLGTKAADRLRRAILTNGFIIADDPFTVSVIVRAQAAAHRFFALPTEIKDRFRPPPGGFVGYFGTATERGSTREPDRPPDLKERYAVGRDQIDHPSGQPCHIDGDVTRDMNIAFADYFHTMDRIVATVLRALCPAVGVEEDYFDTTMSGGLAYLVALSYPKQSGDLVPRPNQLRAGPHRDRSCITILTGDPDQETRGLQMQVDHQWIEVPVPAGALLINAGSMLTDWSSGTFIAPLHRVRNPMPDGSDNECRQTLLFFANPRSEIVLQPLGADISDASPRNPPTVEEYLASMFSLHTRPEPS